MALDTEEGNIREHRDYLKNEEEKRKRARVVRTTIEGPKLRWVSVVEDVKVPIPPPSIAPQATGTFPSYRSVYGPPGSLFTPTTYTYASGSLVKTNTTATSTTFAQGQASTPNVSFSPYTPYQYQISPFPVWPPQQSYNSTSSVPSSVDQERQPSTTPTSTAPAISQAAQAPRLLSDQQPVIPLEPEYKTESATKNYFVHELAQYRGTPKPTWAENMKAIFGDHVKWEELKVFVGKNRPLCKLYQIVVNHLGIES